MNKVQKLNKVMNKAMADFNKQSIIELKKAGKSVKEIAISMDISESRVYQLLKK